MEHDPTKPPQGDILIVDDAPANLRLLSQMLAEQGYRVRPAPDGALALAAARAEPPDLILLDIRMPEMNGYEVCARLKETPETHDIPVIFISALDATQDKVQAFAAGGVDYVTKPFQVEEVLARVETHLALRRLQARLQAANQKMEQELALAGEVQAGFLPRTLPDIPGWQLAATLQPARETSGDFYDVIALPGGRWGLVLADVTDKGAGAALYMALSCTLLRTYAAEYPAEPARVLEAVNRRLLADTRTIQFVTVFYGVLDPASGSLVYGNAGHWPPLVLRDRGAGGMERLDATGGALGMLEGRTWRQDTVHLDPGDLLLAYTDGITEAEDEGQGLYGEARLRALVHAQMAAVASRPDAARALQAAILADVQAFAGAAPQADDLALVVVVRGPAPA